MHPMERARAAAFAVQPGTPAFDAACAICISRGQHPNGMNNSTGLLEWQSVVMEAALLRLVQEGLPL
jgi:hypothetical protein